MTFSNILADSYSGQFSILATCSHDVCLPMNNANNKKNNQAEKSYFTTAEEKNNQNRVYENIKWKHNNISTSHTFEFNARYSMLEMLPSVKRHGIALIWHCVCWHFILFDIVVCARVFLLHSFSISFCLWHLVLRCLFRCFSSLQYSHSEMSS